MGTTFHTYLGECCREWPMAAGFPAGRCGICQQTPTYKGPDLGCTCEMCRPSSTPEAVSGNAI